MKKYILFDHDGVLVDTEHWYFKAGERAFADVDLTLDKPQYLSDMSNGLGTWVVEVLAELSRHARLAVVTTAKRADFDLIHEKRQIRAFMDFVLVREDYERAKPDPEPYLMGLERFGATRAETLVVEDSARGLRSAVAAGIDCAVVHHEFTRSGDFSGATFRIEALGELTDIVRGDGLPSESSRTKQ